MPIPANAPPHLKVAFSYEGQREIKGPATAPFIARMLKRLKAWWTDDEAAWCGTYVAGCLDESNEKYGTRYKWPQYWMRALAYRPPYGLLLTPAQYRPGAICSKERLDAKGKPVGGHVFFYVAETATHILGISGNTSDSVKEAWYPKKKPDGKTDALVVVWPEGGTLEPGDHRNFVAGPISSGAVKED